MHEPFKSDISGVVSLIQGKRGIEAEGGDINQKLFGGGEVDHIVKSFHLFYFLFSSV